jgi:hypothetical protein
VKASELAEIAKSRTDSPCTCCERDARYWVMFYGKTCSHRVEVCEVHKAEFKRINVHGSRWHCTIEGCNDQGWELVGFEAI